LSPVGGDHHARTATGVQSRQALENVPKFSTAKSLFMRGLDRSVAHKSGSCMLRGQSATLEDAL
jgi:hypothetical protein